MRGAGALLSPPWGPALGPSPGAQPWGPAPGVQPWGLLGQSARPCPSPFPPQAPELHTPLLLQWTWDSRAGVGPEREVMLSGLLRC